MIRLPGDKQLHFLRWSDDNLAEVSLVPGGVLPSNRVTVMCRWMGSQARNILYLLSPKFWRLCTRKLAKYADFISLSFFLCREELDATMVLTLFL